MTNAEALFVDTNILVHATVAGAPWHLEARAALRAAAERNRPQWISRQVLREYMAVVSRQQAFAMPMSPNQIIDRIRLFEASFHIADDTAAVTSKLLELIEAHAIGGKQMHDANIAATMLVYRVPALLTGNAKDFRRFDGRIMIEALPSSVS